MKLTLIALLFSVRLIAQDTLFVGGSVADINLEQKGGQCVSCMLSTLITARSREVSAECFPDQSFFHEMQLTAGVTNLENAKFFLENVGFVEFFNGKLTDSTFRESQKNKEYSLKIDDLPTEKKVKDWLHKNRLVGLVFQVNNYAYTSDPFLFEEKILYPSPYQYKNTIKKDWHAVVIVGYTDDGFFVKDSAKEFGNSYDYLMTYEYFKIYAKQLAVVLYNLQRNDRKRN